MVETRRKDGTFSSSKSVQVTVTLWPALYDVLKERATEEDRPLSGLIRYLLMEAVMPEPDYEIT